MPDIDDEQLQNGNRSPVKKNIKSPIENGIDTK
jgi:hypothetical protein